MNFNNCFVMFCLFIYLCLNEQNVKKRLMIKFYIPHLEINIHFKLQNTTLNILIIVDKTYKKVLRLKVDFSNKIESRTFSFEVEKSYNKTVIDFNFGRHQDLSTLKSDIHLGLVASVNYHFFWVDKSLCLPHCGQ